MVSQQHYLEMDSYDLQKIATEHSMFENIYKSFSMHMLSMSSCAEDELSCSPKL